MTQLNEVIFLLQLLIIIGVSLFKFYNLMVQGKLFDFKKGIILFIINCICFGFGLFSALVSTSSILIIQLFKFEVMFFILNFFILIGEVLFFLKEKTIESSIRPNMSNGRN